MTFGSHDAGVARDPDRERCPSCGAPLELSGPTAACGHCGQALGQTVIGGVSEAQPAHSPDETSSELTATRIRCACGYDLSAAVVGGRCPECGASVAAALQPRDQRVQGEAIVALVLSACAFPLICGCAPLGLVLSGTGLVLGIRVLRMGPTPRKSDRTMATIAVVLGSLGSLIGLILSVFLFTAILPGF